MYFSALSILKHSSSITIVRVVKNSGEWDPLIFPGKRGMILPLSISGPWKNVLPVARPSGKPGTWPNKKCRMKKRKSQNRHVTVSQEAKPVKGPVSLFPPPPTLCGYNFFGGGSFKYRNSGAVMASDKYPMV